jgi:photosystem II stability/assembly factor-like uncharacterized protein
MRRARAVIPAKAGIQTIVALGLSLMAFPIFAQHAVPTIEPQTSGVTVRLRGISAVDANVAWASGREGTVLRTLDGGTHWTRVQVPDAKALDFRDIEAFDANTAVVLSIGPGEASRVYRTEDGGQHWSLVLQNTDPRAFFDCMVFEGQRGWMLGDPVDGRYQILTTQDGGQRWTLETTGPEAKPDEAAYAASGTCIARTYMGATLVVSGGADARVHVGVGKNWNAFATPMPHRVPAAGIFSATPMGDGNILLVGGDFEHETVGSAALGVASSYLGPQTLLVHPIPAPRGYRSGAACVSKSSCIGVGPTGVDAWNGEHWSAVSDTGYDAIDLAGTTGWAAGDGGRIARVTVSAMSSKPPQAQPPSTPSKPTQTSPPPTTTPASSSATTAPSPTRPVR